MEDNLQNVQPHKVPKKVAPTTPSKTAGLVEHLNYALQYHTDDGMIRYLQSINDATIQSILAEPKHTIRKRIKEVIDKSITDESVAEQPIEQNSPQSEQTSCDSKQSNDVIKVTVKRHVMEDNLQNLQTLYDNKQYKAAFKMGMQLIKEDTNNSSTLFSLVARAYLNIMTTPLRKDFNEMFIQLVEMACQVSTSIEEVWTVEHDILTALAEWSYKSYDCVLNDLERNPTFEQHKQYLPIYVKYPELCVMVQIRTRNCNLAKEFKKDNGIEDYADYLEQHCAATPEYISLKEMHAREAEAAMRIFAITKARLKQNADANADYVSGIVGVIINELYLTECMVNIPDDPDELMADELYDRLKKKAEILSFLLSAMTYPNGQPMSLIQKDRTEEVEELKNCYAQMQKLDPTFVIPQIPSASPVMLRQYSSAGSGSSGGCYVATAVYGSYDCPEVWTLRRFRDNTLAETWCGRAFIRAYYAISPTLVKWFGKTEWFKNLWKPTLDRMVENLNKNGVEDTPYDDRAW